MIANDGLDEIDLAFVATLAPDDALDVSLLAIVSWVDPETGDSRYKFYTRTNDLVGQTIGLLELAKHDLICGCVPSEDDDG